MSPSMTRDLRCGAHAKLQKDSRYTEADEQRKLRAPCPVFIDETAVTTKMVRHNGRPPRSERLVASVPRGNSELDTR